MGKMKQGINLSSKLTMKYLYTGRKEIDQEFLKEIKEIDEEVLKGEETTPYHIINNYGIGGIGKSSLQRHLVDSVISEENNHRKNPILCVEVDFDKEAQDKSSYSTPTDERNIILMIMDRIKNKYGINTFVCTLCALYKQNMITGENNRRSIVGDFNKRNESKKEKLAFAFFEMIPVVGSMFELFKEVGEIINDPENMSDKDILNMFKKVASKIDDESYDNVLNILKTDSQEIDERLMEYFAQDLRVIIKNKKTPFVFFIDTYENRINTFEDVDEKLQEKEKWLKYLINELPYVLWVIAGRENLAITNDKEWEEITSSNANNEVMQFTDDEVREYMRRARIPTALDSLFIKLSGGIPLILNILRLIFEDLDAKKENIYDEKQYILEADENSENPNRNKRNDVIRRYLKRMDIGKDDKTSYILKQLSVINGGWTDDILNELSPYIMYFDENRYQDLIRTTIIRESNGIYSIPEPVRKIMRSDLDTNTREKVRKGIAEVYKKKVVEDTNSLLGIENIFRFFDNSTDEEKESFYIETVTYIVDHLLYVFRIREATRLLIAYNPLIEKTKNIEFKALYLHSLGFYYQTTGVKDYALLNYEAAYKLFLEFYSADHIRTIGAGINYSSCLTYFGYHKESLEANEAFLETLKTFLRADHPYILTTENNIADSLRQLGDYSRALNVDYDCYKKRQDSLTKNHLDTLSSLLNLSVDYYGLGDYEKSLQIAKDCYNTIEINSLTNHPLAAKTLSFIGINSLKLGQREKALKKFLDSHAIIESLFSIYSSEYTASLNNIARAYRALGKIDEALKIDNECYDIRSCMYGEEYVETLDSLNNIACDYIDLMDYKKALELHEKCFELRKKALLENPQDAYISLRNIGNCLYSLGKIEEALDKYKESYAHLCDSLPTFHPEVIETLEDVIKCLRIKGKYEEAISYCTSFCDTIEREYPKYIKRMDPILNLLSIIYLNLGRKKEAAETSRKRIEISSANNSDVNIKEQLKILDEISHTMFFSENYIEAINYWTKALIINKKSNLIDEHRLIKIQFNIALCFLKLGQYKKSLEWFTICYTTSYEINGIENQLSLNAIEKIAFCEKELGMLDVALQNYKVCYKYRKKVLSDTDPKTVKTLNAYIDCLMEKGSYREAYQSLKDLYDIQKKTLPDKDQETLKTLTRISNVLILLNDFQEAENVASYCFSELSKLFPRDDENTLNAMYCLSLSKQRLGKDSESYNLLSEWYNSSRNNHFDNNYITDNLICNLGICCVALHKDEEALYYLERGYNLLSNYLANNNPTLLNVLYNYAYILKRLGREEEAQKYFDVYYNSSN